MTFHRCLVLATMAASALAADTEKIQSSLVQQFESTSNVNIIVEFKGRAENVLAESAKLESAQVASRAERAELVRSVLVDHATSTQANALKLIQNKKQEESLSVEPKQLWISNSIAIANAPKTLVQELAKLPEVVAIRREAMGRLITSEVAADAVAGNSTEWGISMIQAPEVWAKGYKGQGVVVGSIDTGARSTHEAIKDNFRKENGYFQPEGHSPVPVDSHGHGTHTVGTSVGGKGIGVAPEAKWISCEGCLPSGKCPESVLVACAQFMLCPHDTDGKNPRCDLAPHVVNNSWGDDDEIPDVPYYKGPMAAWRKAGIIPVFANANNGPKCGTVLSPGDYDNVIGVGATTSKDALATFSSKGPNKYGRMKPDISAPGQSVRSSYKASDTSYTSMSGTSMATPHVTGAIALMISAKPGITYDEVYSLLTTTVETKSLQNDPLTCGGLPGDKYPNNNFGYGRMNILRAIEKLHNSC